MSDTTRHPDPDGSADGRAAGHSQGRLAHGHPDRDGERPVTGEPAAERSEPSGSSRPSGPSGPEGASEPVTATEPDPADDRVLVVTPQGVSVTSDTGDERLTELVEQPAKVMRIGSMIKQLLEEVRSAPLDDAGRARLADVHSRSIAELESGLAPELVEELERIALPFTDETVPSDAELRVAQAQLVGWLEGLFHGIQTALFAQQIAARAQFEEMRRRAALPGPVVAQPGVPGAPPDQESRGGTGHYL